MVVHDAKTKTTAKKRAEELRRKGKVATIYKKKSGYGKWAVRSSNKK